MRDAVVLVVVRGPHNAREVLLMKRAAHRDASPGLWETVSGRVERGETLQAAAVRELGEETGLRTAQVGTEPIDHYSITRRGEPMRVHVFAAVLAEAEAVTRSAEHDAHAWCTCDDPDRRTALRRIGERGVPARLVAAIARVLETLG